MAGLDSPRRYESLSSSRQIRKAIPKDASALREITQKLSITREERGKVGFVDFKLPDEKRYEDLIQSGGIYVLEQEGKVVGFVSCFDSNFLKEQFSGHNDAIVDYLMQTKQGRYRYLEQLAVLEEYRQHNAAFSLCDRLMVDLQEGDTIWTAICVDPIKNFPSLHVAAKYGAVQCEQISAYNGLTFQLLRITVKKSKNQ